MNDRYTSMKQKMQLYYYLQDMRNNNDTNNKSIKQKEQLFYYHKDKNKNEKTNDI